MVYFYKHNGFFYCGFCFSWIKSRYCFGPRQMSALSAFIFTATARFC